MTIQSNMTTEDPMTTTQVRTVQLENGVSHRFLQWPKSENSLSRVEANICICGKYRGNGDRGTKVGQGFDGPPIPRYDVSKGPGGVGDEEDDSRLI